MKVSHRIFNLMPEEGGANVGPESAEFDRFVNTVEPLAILGQADAVIVVYREFAVVPKKGRKKK